MLVVEQKADINHLGIVSRYGMFHIVCEWSYHAIESYDTLTEAIDFIRGFKRMSINKMTNAYMDGYMLKSCATVDNYLLSKLTDIDKTYPDSIKL